MDCDDLGGTRIHREESVIDWETDWSRWCEMPDRRIVAIK